MTKSEEKRIVAAVGGRILPDGSVILPMTFDVMNALLMSQSEPRRKRRSHAKPHKDTPSQ